MVPAPLVLMWRCTSCPSHIVIIHRRRPSITRGGSLLAAGGVTTRRRRPSITSGGSLLAAGGVTTRRRCPSITRGGSLLAADGGIVLCRRRRRSIVARWLRQLRRHRGKCLIVAGAAVPFDARRCVALLAAGAAFSSGALHRRIVAIARALACDGRFRGPLCGLPRFCNPHVAPLVLQVHLRATWRKFAGVLGFA